MAVAASIAALLVPAVVSAEPTVGPEWAPPQIVSAGTDETAAFEALHRSDARAGRPGANRTDDIALTAGDRTFDVVARVRDLDYRIDEKLGDASLAMGRSGSLFWRRNAAGTTRTVYVDVAGDDADRWPVAAFGFDAADCALAGVAEIPQATWVILDRPAEGVPHWLFVDKATGDVVREVSREGSRVVTYDFSDYDGAPGERRARRWRISGAGGDATITVRSTNAGGVSAADVARPEQGPPQFTIPAKARRLSAVFNGIQQMTIDLRIDGKRASLVLDSGTASILLGPAAAHAGGGAPALGHGIAATIVVDDATATAAPFQTVPDFEGILGYDFFRGRIIHIDYRNAFVEMLPRDGFSPPAGSLSLPTDWSEGMPIVSARIGNVPGNRFVLDTGSSRVLLSRHFAESFNSNAYRQAKATTIETYNEGSLSVAPATIPAMFVGTTRITDVPAMIQMPNPENLDIPLDGIIGTEQMSRFEWWFDADGTLSWYRPYR